MVENKIEREMGKIVEAQQALLERIEVFQKRLK